MVGLASGVSYVHDVWNVYLDDGTRVFRMTEAEFEQLVDRCLAGQGEALLTRYPTLLQPFSRLEDARQSFGLHHG